jgi:hypothetical protein
MRATLHGPIFNSAEASVLLDLIAGISRLLLRRMARPAGFDRHLWKLNSLRRRSWASLLVLKACRDRHLTRSEYEVQYKAFRTFTGHRFHNFNHLIDWDSSFS